METKKTRGGWNKGLTKQTSPLVAKNAVGISKAMTGKTGRVHTEATKKKQSIAAKKNNLGGHTSKKRLNFIKKNGDVVHLQSSYEIEFATLLEELDIDWERPAPLTWFDDDGIDHRYYADFKVGNVYIDTKNDYLAVKDKPKIDKVIQQNKVDVRIVTKEFINKEYILNLG